MEIQTSEHISLWNASSDEKEFAGQIDTKNTTDVAIACGGFTGLSTALHAAETGISCYVLEAGKIGFGALGSNAGLVNAGLWLPPSKIEKNMEKKRVES